MAAYEYEALDADGRTKRGIVSGDTARMARRELRRQNLVPVKLEEARERKPKSGEASGFSLSLSNKIGAKDLTLFTRQLATLVGAAAPVEEAIHTIALQSDKPSVRKTLLSVRGGVTEGLRLSQAMAEHAGSFPPLYRSMVATGEASGTLGPVLERLADHMERARKMRSKITTALVYPAFLAVTAMFVVGILMAFVVPKVVEQFDGLGRELPMLTQIMITISNGVRDYGLMGLGAVIAGIFVLMQLLKNETVRRRVDGFILRLPFIGKIVRQVQAAQLARTLGALVASGTPVLEALTAARGTVRNLVLRDAVNDAVTQVREGVGLANALRRTAAFPPLVIYMTAMGEKSGSLDVMLEKAANYLEEEFDALTAATLSLLEPAIIIIMGVVTATIVLSILLPILQFNSLAAL